MVTFSRSTRFGWAFTVLAIVCGPPTAMGLPSGRSWTEAERFFTPEYDYFPNPRLHVDSDGVPLVHVSGYLSYGLGARGTLHKFAWADSEWTVRWKIDRYLYLGDINYTGTVPQLMGEDFDSIPRLPDFHYIVIAPDSGDHPGPFDSVMVVSGLAEHFSGAITKRGRWAAANVRTVAPPYVEELQAYHSDRQNHWKRVGVAGCSGYYGYTWGIALDADDDTTALLLWRCIEPRAVRWGFLRWDTWQPAGEFSPAPQGGGPVLRPRAGGGHWLVMSRGGGTVQVFSNQTGTWTEPLSVSCDYYPGWMQQYTDSPTMSRDAEDFPVLAWSTFQIAGGRAQECICVSIPSDSEFTLADQVWSAENALQPSVVRDRNGDVWVTWWNWGPGGMWKHTYVSARAMHLHVQGEGKCRIVTWRLSEKAPGSFWAVWRARRDGPFEQVARLRASDSVVMSWRDDAPPADTLRYRIGRESVDRRYSWTSEETVWSETSRKGLFVIPRLIPGGQRLEFQVIGAGDGPLDVRLFDVQGRLMIKTIVHRHELKNDLLTLEPGHHGWHASSGVYFLRVTEGLEGESATVRTALIE